MKIALVVNEFPKISETFILNQAISLTQRGNEVTVIANNSQDDQKYYQDQKSVLQKIRIVNSISSRNLLSASFYIIHNALKNLPSFVTTFIKSLKVYGLNRKALRSFLYSIPLVEDKFDVIHFEFSGLAIAYFDCFPLLNNSKLFMSCRGMAELITPSFNPNQIANLLKVSFYMDRIHCVSVDMANKLEKMGLSRRKMFVNYPSIDINQFKRGIPYQERINSPYQLISVSRLHWKKGLEYGLQCTRILIDQGLDVHYSIIGEGLEKHKLKFEIRELALENNVTLCGQQNSAKVKSMLETADIFLLPSLSEGLSNSLLEAMALELPVISTSVGGMPEILINGENGFLCQPRNPQEMANQVIFLIKQGWEFRRKIGINARETVVNKLSIYRQTEIFINEYDALVNG